MIEVDYNPQLQSLAKTKYQEYLDMIDVKELPKLKAYQISKYEFLINADLGYYPYLTVELRDRIRKHKIINGLITGEAGAGKSYNGTDLARLLSRKFDVEDIPFNYMEFLKGVVTRPRGTPQVFDEPQYAMSKKDWYKEVTKALVKTIESFRFKGKPLFIPIINKQLIDSDIRNYLIQYHIVMHDRGRATAYRIYTSQFQQKQYNYGMCDIHYELFDNNLCDKASCLTCRKLNNRDISKRCNIFRARYERKKQNIQDKRYEDDMQEARNKEQSRMSNEEVKVIAMRYFDKFYNEDKNKIDVDMMKVIIEKEEEISLGHNRKYEIAKLILYDYPELFEPKPPINKDNVDDVT